VLARRCGLIEERQTLAPGDAERLVREAALAQAEKIIVAGGDGTLGEAINGLADPETGVLYQPAPEIIYVPLGSGGDFARAAGFARLTLEEAMTKATARTIDLGRLTLQGKRGEKTRLFVNIASVGLSADIASRANRAGKWFGGAMAFQLATLRGLFAWADRRVRLSLDGVDAGEMDVSLIALANGRWFGSGMCIAPNADLSSGELEVVVLRNASVGLFLRHGGKLKRGEHLHLPQLWRTSARTVSIEPLDPGRPLEVEADGECPGHAPCRAEILPGAAVLVAPW
jgi:YegS/Rv2252/BmrU family lipid kinase